MKKLSMFTYFDFESFAKDKKIMCTGNRPWKDFDSDKILGTKIDAVIVADNTNYSNKDGQSINNAYEKFTIKIPKIFEIQVNAVIRAVNPVARVYGNYGELLSVTADNIEVLSKS